MNELIISGIDRREEILNQEHRKFVEEEGISSIHTTNFPKAYQLQAFAAMDVYMKECALELLGYVAKKVSNFWIDDNGEAKFRLSGDEELTKEQLFENFL